MLIFLKSVKSVSEAVLLIPQVCDLLSHGSFNLTKFLSNSREVIQSISEDKRAPSVKHYDLDDKLPFERALGLQWDVQEDQFTFKITPKEKPLTRRGILSVTSALFDPLGLVSPVTMMRKLLLQDLCRLKLG